MSEGYALLIGLVLAFAVLMRFPGVSAAAAVVTFLLSARKKREAAIVFVCVAIGLGSWTYRNMMVSHSLIEPGHGRFLQTTGLSVIAANIRAYSVTIPDSIIHILNSKVTTGLLAGAYIPILVGVCILFWSVLSYSIVRRSARVHALYVLFCIPILLIWPLTQDSYRLTLPILPSIIICILHSAPQPKQRHILAAGTICVGIGMFMSFRNVFRPDTPVRNTDAGMAYLKAVTAADEVVGSDLPESVWLETGRRAERVTDRVSFDAARSRFNIHYVLIGPQTNDKTIPHRLERSLVRDLEVVWNDKSDNVTIYQVRQALAIK